MAVPREVKHSSNNNGLSAGCGILGTIDEQEEFLTLPAPLRGARRGRPQFVYFATDGEAIKIGCSTEPRRRLSEMQVGHPRRLTMLKICKGDKATEARLHTEFRDLNIAGEWFRIEPRLLDAIEAIPNYERPASSPPLENWIKRQSEIGWPNKEAEEAAFMVLSYWEFSMRLAPPVTVRVKFKEWLDRLEAAMSRHKGRL
jgi:hypothetical protein